MSTPHLYLPVCQGFPHEPHHQSQLPPVDVPVPVLPRPKINRFLLMFVVKLGSFLTPSKTRNVSRSSSSAFSSLTLIPIMVRNSGKSILPVPSLSTSCTMSCSSASVGFCPSKRSTCHTELRGPQCKAGTAWRSCPVSMFPSPPGSHRRNASCDTT